MKKYISPSSKLIRLDFECSILEASKQDQNIDIDNSGEDFDASESYSNKKTTIWSDSYWLE